MMLRPATAEDLAFIRGLVQRPARAPFLTDEDEVALSYYLTDPSAHLLIWGERRGFALFCGVGLPGAVVELRRLCLDQPGQGEGATFIQTLTDHAFVGYGAARVWMDCSGENVRAQRVYAREGYTLEGRLRSHDYVPLIGRFVDTLLYGMLRQEWRELPRRSGAIQS